MRFVFLSVLSLLLLRHPVFAEVHDVLAHGSVDRSWIAKVSAAPAGGGNEQTDILIRQSGPGEMWKTLATVPTRVSALACRSSQLVVLQSNGDWKLIWSSEGGTSGQPLPGHGRIRAIGDDGENLWAVGSVNGGLAAATEPVATEPTSIAAPSSQPLAPYKLVLFEQQAGKWRAVAEFRPEPDTDDSVTGEVSLAIVESHPIVAFQLFDGSIRTLRYVDHTGWEDLGLIPVSNGVKVSDFKIINSGSGPILWTTSGKQPGQIYPGADGKSPPVPLKWSAENGPDSPPAITAAGGYLRLIALHNGNLFEQRYETDGTPYGTVAVLQLPQSLNNSPLKEWLNGALLVALGFSVMATLYRRAVLRRRLTELKPPVPAPIFLRVASGFIDILPVLGTVVWVTIHQDSARDTLDRLEDVPALIAFSISVAVYLLHTTVCELFTARSFGKWLFGLKVVSIDGTKPNSSQLLIRNILRVLDVSCFPLLILAIISPLRQRSADIAAGTMVVTMDESESRVPEEPPTGPDSPTKT